MSTASESSFRHGDASFYAKTWTPEGPVKAKLVFVHGYSEHIGRYDDFFPKLAEKGIQVFGWDQRGWGRSVTKPAEKGLTGPTALVISDVAAFIKDKLNAGNDAPFVPLFVMGHSMGGGEVLTLAADLQYASLVSQIRGWILESPFLANPPGEEPSRIKIHIGRLVGRILPKRQLVHEVSPQFLSRDEKTVQSFRDDPLCHNTGTLEGLSSLLDRTAYLSSGRAQLGKDVRSVFLAHGTGDKVCSYDAAVKFLQQQHAVEDKTTKSYEGAYHQLHADHCKDELAKDVAEWILERSSKPGPVNEAVEAKL